MSNKSRIIPHTTYPNPLSLSEDYRQLEGFTATTSISTDDSKVLTMADVQRETTVLPSDSWADMLVTLSAIFGLLIVSSVALGLAANQVTVITKYLTHHTTPQVLKGAENPTTWQF
ncbi:MAG: hypothetical protein WBD47_09065 [Phormidesmis sp.]